MHTLVRLMAGIVLWAVALMPLVAQADQENTTSIVINIQRSADEVSAKLLKDLTARITEMVARWDSNLQKTLALQEQVKKDGHPAQVAQFEDQLSRSMQQAGQDLAEILAQRDAAKTGLDKLEKVIADGSKVFQDQGRKIQAEQTKIAADLKQVETRLSEIAERHRHMIQNNRLTPELEILVRTLEAERRNLELRGQLRKRTAEVAAAHVERLEQYRAHIGWLQGFSQLAFKQAGGQLQLLADLAEFRRLGVSIVQSSQILLEFAKASADFSKMVQQTQGLVEVLTNLPMPGDLMGPAPLSTVDLQPTESLKILKSYLGSGRQVRK